MARFQTVSRHRWVSLVAGALIALYTLLILSSISVVISDRALTERQNSRSLVVSEKSEKTDVFVRPSREVWRGKNIFVAWLDPAGASDASVLPPGLTELPEPGTAAVSPALDDLAREHPSLARLYPQRTVIGHEGVGRATELVAYVRPPLGRGLGGHQQALHVDHGEVTGDATTVRVSGFGDGGALPLFDDEPRPWWAVPALAAAFGVVPALVLLVLGLRSSTGARRPRVFLALPGIAMGSAAWLLWSSQSDFVPLTPVAVVPGDRAIALTFVAMVSFTCLVMVLVSHLAGWRGSRPGRDRSGAPPSIILRVLPLAASAVLFAVSSFPQLRPGFSLLPIASLCAVLGACLVIPVLLNAVGERFATSPRLSPELVGRSFQLDPARAARPFYGLAVLIMMFIIFLPSSFASEEGLDSGDSAEGFSAVQVQWLDVEAGDFAAFRGSLRSGEAFLVGTSGHEEHSHQHTHEAGGDDLLVGATCEELASIIATECVRGEPRTLSVPAAAEIARVIERAVGELVNGVVLVGRGRLADSGRVVVLGRQDVESLDADTREAARSALPAASIDSEATLNDAHADQRTVRGLVYRLLMFLGFAALLAVVDSIMRDRDLLHVRPTSQRVSGSLLRRFRVVKFLAGWWSIGALGTAIGWMVRIQTPGADQRDTALLGVESIILGLVAGAVIGVVTILTLGGSELEPPARPLDA